MSQPDKFYQNAESYWSDIPATVDGMLGGYGRVSNVDVRGSSSFMKQIFKQPNAPGCETALDCGAGIGRITKNLLVGLFKCVDLVEQNSAFLEQAKELLKGHADRVGEFYAEGLQSFVPATRKYDVIWAQWVLGHLTEQHFIKFLESCKRGLKPNGIVVIKENITSTGEIEVDETDSSVTRPYKLYMELFEKAGMTCFKKHKQPHFPKELYTVYMFALRPTEGYESSKEDNQNIIPEVNITPNINRINSQLELGETMECILGDYKQIVEQDNSGAS